MKINVTQEDIDTARKMQQDIKSYSPTLSCPITLAATRLFQKTCSWGYESGFVDVTNPIGKHTMHVSALYTETAMIRNWVLDFDNRIEVKPIAFEVFDTAEAYR